MRWPPRIASAVMRGLLAATAISARSTTAMRMATPLCTCSRIADCRPSATPAVISMPRMIGPGCSTIALGACAASRWPVSW